MKTTKYILLLVYSLRSGVGGCPSCEGEGSTCKLVSGLFTKGALSPGYNHLTTIPVGACSINITLIRPSSNRLGLGVTGEENFLNPPDNQTATGLYHAAGSSFYYYRGDTRSREQILGEGPIKKSLNLQLFVVEMNRGVEYRYMFPMDKARDVMRGKSRGRHHQTGRGARYSWTLKTLTVCSRSCGGGYQTTVAVCIRSSLGKVVPDSRCSATNKPTAQIVRCNRSPCPPTWVAGGWGQCSATCGQGVQERKILCQQEFSKSMRVTVASSACPSEPADLITTRKCSLAACEGPATAAVVEPVVQMLATQPQDDRVTNGSFISGKHSGHENRPNNNNINNINNLHNSINNRNNINIAQVSSELRESFSKASINQQRLQSKLSTDLRSSLALESAASEPLQYGGASEPPLHSGAREPLLLVAGKTEWIAQPWGRCSVTCGPGVRERRVHCVDKRGGLLPDSRCVKLSRPDSEGFCDQGPCLTNQWFFSQWDTCTAHCGEGEQHRVVYCIGECREQDRPDQTRKCRAQRECSGEWFTGRWSVCSKSCGEGRQTREVMCTVKDDDTKITGSADQSQHRIVSADECRHRRRPRQHRKCEIQACRPRWFTTDWSKCSAGCGEGVSTRTVVCLHHNTVSTRCRGDRPHNDKVCKGECKKGEAEDEDEEEAGLDDEDDGWQEYDELLDQPEFKEDQMDQDFNQDFKGKDPESSSSSSSSSEGETTRILSNNVIAAADKPVKPGHKAAGSACTDKFKNCNIVVQSRLCNYSFYQANCCRSCTLTLP